MRKSFILFFFITACILGVLSTYTHINEEVLYLTPTFEDANGWEIYTMKDGTRREILPRGIPDVEQGETFYLSRTLTEEWSRSGYTFLLLDSKRPSSVFMDRKLLYSTCPSVRQTIGQIVFPRDYKGLTGRGEAIRITIPEGYEGKEITIATTHPISEYASSMPGIMLSSQVVEAAVWMNTANHNSMPAAGFAVVAMLLLGLLSYSLFHGSRNWPLLLLVLTAFCNLFYYLRQYSFSSPGITAMDTPLAAFIPTLAMILPEFYLLLQMKRQKKFCRIVVWSTGILSLIPAAANLFGSPGFGTTPFVETLYIGLLALVVSAVIEAWDQNRVFQIFLYGLAGVCIGIGIGCFFSVKGEHLFVNYVVSLMEQVVRHDPMLFLQWCGIVFFALASAIGVYQVIRSAADTQTELAVQKERSTRLDYELFIQKEIYEAKLSGEEELRSLRHDMKGHLRALSELLADSKVQEAAAYLSGLTKHHQERKSEAFCGNPYINAVLRTYSTQFKDNNITFVCQVGVDIQTLPCVELCLILNNAMENAMEASLKRPETERIVKLKARIWHGQFLLRVSNRFDGILKEHSGLPVSSKKEQGHGYGMSNMHSMVLRLGGEMNYQVEEGYFVLDVHFPLQGEQADQDTK